jgi:NAD(P)-dependent dehydrogenase (short-subunit alcohol dehydrogenase family)
VPQAHFDAVRNHQSLKRSGEPEDQAAAISFMVLDDAGFMSGQTMLVDGGQGTSSVRDNRCSFWRRRARHTYNYRLR